MNELTTIIDKICVQRLKIKRLENRILDLQFELHTAIDAKLKGANLTPETETRRKLESRLRWKEIREKRGSFN